MLSSIVSWVLGRLPVTPETLELFFSSVWEFLLGFVIVYLVGRYLFKPVLGRLLKNRTIVVLNSEIGNSPVTNHSDKDYIKIVVPIGVGYDEDLAVAKKLAVDEALKISTVMKDPMPGVSVVGLSDSWVDMKLAVWIDSSDHATMFEIRDDLVSHIEARFGQENIHMPYKTRALAGQLEVANIDSDNDEDEDN